MIKNCDNCGRERHSPECGYCVVRCFEGEHISDASEWTERTCGDCIHADICARALYLTEFSVNSPAYCKGFKNKADYVEVVRCDGCKHGDPRGCRKGFVWCKKLCMYTNEMGYCSIGERRPDDST